MDTLTPGLTRAAIWRGSSVAVEEVAVPPLADTEVLVRVRLATVCGSDLHTVSGRRTSPCPSILGHESVGEVVAVGDGAPVSVGDRVIWSVTVSCGTCDRCTSGLTAKCRRVRKVGHEPFHGDWPLSGGYAEHILLPRGTTVVRVPDVVPDAVAAPAACATATVMAAVERAGDVWRRRVLIAGAGMLGVTAAAACRDLGADVVITDRHADRLALAESFGARADDGHAVDVAIDFTGSTDAVADAFDRLEIGGTMVLAGSVTPGPNLVVEPERVVRQWLTLRGVHNYEPRHLHQAVDFLHRTLDTYPWASLITEPVGLADIASALSPAPVGKLRVAVAP